MNTSWDGCARWRSGGAASGGGVFHVAGGALSVVNSSGSVADGPITIEHSIVENGFTGRGNVARDPRFVDPTTHDYRLRADSPAIDAADGDTSPPVDFLGDARFDAPVANTGVGTPPYADIGAYEWR